MKTALTIAGSDCSGGAGIQADLKTFSAHGVYGMSVITSVVAENTTRVITYQDIEPEIIRDQMQAVFEDIRPDAVKVGMLSNPTIMETVASGLEEWKPAAIVLDPVMVAKNGSSLMEDEAVSTLIDRVLPLASVITPNIPEAERIAGGSIESLDEMKEAARTINAGCHAAVLVKGGHATGDATDVLYDGDEFHYYSGPRIKTTKTHGTGCTLSSAIASWMALGLPLDQAVGRAKTYITGAIEHALPLGHGHGPTNHFHRFFPEAATRSQEARQ